MIILKKLIDLDRRLQSAFFFVQRRLVEGDWLDSGDWPGDWLENLP
jgi:hypothetical protein